MGILTLVCNARFFSQAKGTPSASAVTSSVDVRELDFDYYRVGLIQEKYAGDNEDEDKDSIQEKV
jgi:hypothetical protein